jgi:ferredoxin
VNELFARRMRDRKVAHDTRVLGDFTAIYCRGNHADRARSPLVSGAVALGVYGRRPPLLCDECAAHLIYAEERRAYCPVSPKPFCAHCDSHCYRPREAEWQRVMMRYSGPRSVLRGHAIDGLKHVIEGRAHRRQAEPRRSTPPEPPEEGPAMSPSTVTRQIVSIDEELCTGCGLCVSPCAEGAIVIENGKAKVVRDELCDGAGFCLGVCPTGALTIETREAVEFDHAAAEQVAAERGRTYIMQTCFKCGASEDDRPLLPVRTEGTSTWVCTRCLPALIHG